MSTELLNKITSLNKDINDDCVRLDYLKKRLDDDKKKIENFEEEMSICKQSLLVAENVIDKNYKDIIAVFENIITTALKDLFDESYEFRFDRKQHATHSDCSYQLHTNEYEGFIDIQYSHGNSVREIIGVALRIIITKLDNNINNLILLDEPLSGLEPDRQIEAARFIQKVANEFGIQVIFITQNGEMMEYGDNKIWVR